MIQRITRARKANSEEGFTLIELLVVIIILGILAAVVVFAVGGVGDKGQTAACTIDTRTLRTAEEANLANKGSYATESDLVVNGFLSEQSQWHTITNIVAANPGATPPVLASFVIEVEGPGVGKCGPGGAVGTSGNI